MKQLSIAQQTVLVVGISWLVGLTAPRAFALEKKTFVAYSMQVAQGRVAEAVRKGEDFRTKQPDLFYLGGITKPWAVVLDIKTGDWMLVGERDPKSAVLTLDDWVVALRARFIHGGMAPGVTIEPKPTAACLRAGQSQLCSDATRQAVRFFGGIEDTHFAQVCYEADWLMKKIGLGLEKVPVKQLKTYYELSLEQVQKAPIVKTRIVSRFWFYPIVNRVNVWSDVVLLEKFQLGVFTEVLAAEVKGRPVVDVTTFAHSPSEGFSRSFSDNYDAAAQAREVLETLRGLTRLAALAKGLTQVDEKPKPEFFLTRYPMAKLATPKEVEVLRVENQEVGLEIAGGVSLTALALRLQGGDVRALRELVVRTRPSAKALSWGFEVHMQDGQLKGVILPPGMMDPNQIVPLFQQAVFLWQKKHYAAAIEFYNKILQLNPKVTDAYYNRGITYADKGDYEQALADYNQAIALDPAFAEAYNNRGFVYAEGKRDYDRAITDFNRALALNPNFADAYYNRGETYRRNGSYDRAITDFDKVLALSPNLARAYLNRGTAYGEGKRDHDRAIADYNEALTLDPNYARAYYNRGTAYRDKGVYERAIADFTQALALNPNLAEAYLNRGVSYAQGKRDYERAFADFNQALALDPNLAGAYLNRGFIYAEGKRDYDRALTEYTKALALNPDFADAYYSRGTVYLSKRDYDRAIADFTQALALSPNLAGAYNNRAVAWFFKKNYDKAWADVKRCRELGCMPIPAFIEDLRKASGRQE